MKKISDRRLKIDPTLTNLVVFDFDGVFTNNRVYVLETGLEMVQCSRADGIGLRKLEANGIKTLVLSTEQNEVVGKRCAKLKIECLQGSDHKGQTLHDFITKHKIDGFVCYVGNDDNDLPALPYVDMAFAVKDSFISFKSAADYITHNSGGNGAVREVCEYISKQIESEDSNDRWL